MGTIQVTSFQPFTSRVGIDTVLALHFRFDAEIVRTLKAALRATDMHNAGGWPTEHRCWFVELCVWYEVKEALLDAGYTVGAEQRPGRDYDDPPRPGRADDESPRPGRAQPPVAWEPLVSAWYRKLCLKFHPDRGG